MAMAKACGMLPIGKNSNLKLVQLRSLSIYLLIQKQAVLV
jgi:hypothetical protein